jgi:DHA1 family multidrug resistance protein-like MFS transporter
MTSHFRDTVFGQFVRLITRKGLLKFPDELDPTLWKQCVQSEMNVSSSIFGEFCDLADSRDHVGNLRHKKSIVLYLVDWYGPDDEEVRNPSIHTSITANIMLIHA